MVEDLTNENFKDKIAKGNTVVDFYADWCGPCQMMKPEFEAAGGELENVTFFKVNVDQAQEVAGSMGVRGIPMVVFFRDGEKVHRFVGAKSKAEILEEVKKAFG